jgi:hypothetical protein
LNQSSIPLSKLSNVLTEQKKGKKKMAINEPKTLSKARSMHAVMADIEGSLAKDLTAAALAALIGKADDDTAQAKKLKSQIAAVVSSKKGTFKEINEFMKRVRSGAKSAFGDDSLEFERVGGKRASERKKKAKKS